MPPKLLIISYRFNPDIGGIETSSEFLAETFLKAGYIVKVLTNTLTESESTFSYDVIRNPSIRKIFAYHFWADIILENNPCVRLGFPKFFFKKKTIIVLHTWLNISDDRKKISDRIKLHYLKSFTKVVAVSQALQKRCWPTAEIIENTYNDRLFKKTSNERSNDFVFVGRLVSDKGAELAIKAFSYLAFTENIPEMVTSSLTIIGDGEDRQKLESIVVNLPDRNRVRILGSLKGKELANELNRHSFQFIPSMWEEPFGIVALEGIACGLIPIASDGGGLPDAIGKAGVLFKRGQLSSLLSVTKSLIQSENIQLRCLEEAPDHLHNHSQNIIANRYINLIESVL